MAVTVRSPGDLGRRADGCPPAPAEALLRATVEPVLDERPLGDDLAAIRGLVEAGKLPCGTAGAQTCG